MPQSHKLEAQLSLRGCLALCVVTLAAVTLLQTSAVSAQQDLCQSSNCSNFGDCQEYGEFRVCSCVPGHTGFQCEFNDCSQHNCFGKGSCSDNLCTCDPPFIGSTCQVEACVPGDYFNVAQGICLECPLGYFNPSPDTLFCLKALPGMLTIDANGDITSAGAVDTTPCPVGFECPQADTKNSCTPGTYAEGGASKCSDCPAGTFNDEPQASSCTLCPQATYSDNEGADSCAPVPSGYYATRGEDLNFDGIVDAVAEGATNVLPCPGGHKCDDGMFTPCPAGTTPDPAQTACVDCPAHTYAPSPGTPSCIQCPADSFAEPGWDECLTVPAGFYRTAVGISPCPPGFACGGGSLQPSKCRPGQIPVLGNSTCQICPAGTITRDNVTCTACPEPSQTSTDGRSCFEVFQGCVASVAFTTSNKDGRARLPGVPQPTQAVVDGQQLSFSIESSVDLATHVFHAGEQEVVFTADYLNSPTCTVTVYLTYGITQEVSRLSVVQDDTLREVRDYILSDSSLLGGALVSTIDVQRDSFAFHLVPENGASFTVVEDLALLGQATLQGHLSYCHASVPATDPLNTTLLTQSGALAVSPFSATGASASITFSESCFVASFDVSLDPLEPKFPDIMVEITFPSGSNLKRGQYFPNAHSGIWLRDPGPRYNTTDRPILAAVDADPPVFVYCPEDITAVFAYNEASLPIAWLPAVAEDNVEVAFVESTHDPGTEFALSELPAQVTYTATDANDNVATCVFTVDAFYPFWNEEEQTTIVNAGQAFDSQIQRFDSQHALAFTSILGGPASAYFREFDLSHNRFRFIIEAESKHQFSVAPFHDEVSLDIFLVFRPTQVPQLVGDFVPQASGAFLRVTLKEARNARTEEPVEVPEGWFRDDGTSFSLDAITMRGSGSLPAAEDGLLFTSIEFELSLPGLGLRGETRTTILPATTANRGSVTTGAIGTAGSTTTTAAAAGSTTTATWASTNSRVYTTAAPYTRSVDINGTTLALADLTYSVVSGHAGLTRFADNTPGVAGTSAASPEADDTVPAFFSVIGLDLEPPTLTCPEEAAVEADPETGEAVVTETLLRPTYSDNSGNVTITSTINGTYPIGAHNVTFWAFDPYDNVATCTVPLHVLDSTGAARTGGSGLSNAAVTGIAIGIIVFLLLTTTFFWMWRVKRLTRPKPYDFEDRLRELAEHLRGEDGLIKPREIKRENIRQLDVLGAGHWGEVAKGILEEHKSAGIPGYLVAIKTLKTDSVDSQDELMREAAFMAQLNNDYVVKLYGVCTFGGPMMMIMEYCEHGSLQAYLRKHDMPVQQRIQVLCDAASGLLYLSSRGIVHRDVASRNVLLSSEWRGRIADFGMSRESEAESAYYHSRGGAVPVRWSAPEALEDHKFSEKSDIWSFGIMCYETFTNGGLPYKGMSNQKVWVSVMEGYRLPPPEGCPAVMYALMKDCWMARADERPTFQEVVNTLTSQLQHHSENVCKGSADTMPPLGAECATQSVVSDRYAHESSFLGKAAKDADTLATSANSTSVADSAISPNTKSTSDVRPPESHAESYVDLTSAVHVNNATGQRGVSPASRASVPADTEEKGYVDVTQAEHVCFLSTGRGEDDQGPGSHSGRSKQRSKSSGRSSTTSSDEHVVQLYSAEHARGTSPASSSVRGHGSPKANRHSSVVDFLNTSSPVVPPRPSLNSSRATTSPATTTLSIYDDDDDDDDDDDYGDGSDSHYLEPTPPASSEPHYEDPPPVSDRRKSRLNHCETLAPVPAARSEPDSRHNPPSALEQHADASS